jgi:hypothetical protein
MVPSKPSLGWVLLFQSHAHGVSPQTFVWGIEWVERRFSGALQVPIYFPASAAEVIHAPLISDEQENRDTSHPRCRGMSAQDSNEC